MKENNTIDYNAYEESKKRKKNCIIALIIMILLGVGYAYLQTLLNISGTANVSANNWSVYWYNIQPKSGSVTPSTGNEATIDDDEKTSISFTIDLEKPGDFYEFTVQAKNDGSIDAMIGSVKQLVDNSETIPDYLEYSVTYDDGIPILEKQILKSETSETLRVKVAYKKNITADDLPKEEDKTHICTLNINYVQADSTASKIRIFTDSGTPIIDGQPIPENITTYDNYNDAINNITHTLFLKHTIENNKISKSSIVINRNGVEYNFLEGENNFNTNIEVFNNLFGKSCESFIQANQKYYLCTSDQEDQIKYIIGITTNPDVIQLQEKTEYGCIITNQRAACGDLRDSDFRNLFNN